MITISEEITPKFSYKNILKNPLTKEVFISAISQLGIQETVKKDLINQFTNTINNFKDFSYTGDINYFKATLFTTLSDTDKDISLLDVLSTEEFVEKSTKEIENLISISLTDNNINVSLNEYINRARKIGERTPNILPALRGLYSFDNDRQIHRDTAELIAALKKHLITNDTDGSTTALSSLVEKNKQNEYVMRTDEAHYNTIKSYSDALFKGNCFEGPDDYLDMINKIKTALEYFSHSNDYKKEKLDKLMYVFLKNLTEYGLSQYQERYGYIGSDIFSIEFKQKANINELINLLNNHKEYTDFVIKIINDKIIKLQNQITQGKKAIDNFYRPTREERCIKAPYRGAPIKSDQEYQRELNNIKLKLDMNTKNLVLIKSYIPTI